MFVIYELLLARIKDAPRPKAALALAFHWAVGGAAAQNYPAKPIFDRIVEALQASLKDPDFANDLDKDGYTEVPRAETLPAAQARRAKAEVERSGKLLREAGIKPQ